MNPSDKVSRTTAVAAPNVVVDRANRMRSQVTLRAHPAATEATIGGVATRELVFMACCAVLIRAALFMLGTHVNGWSVDDFVRLRDGSSYIHLAQAFRGDQSVLSSFDRRVFPGYPALIAAVSLVGISIPVAALALCWLATGVTAALTAVLYDDLRVGWAIVMLTPSYLMYTTTVMSEGVLLAFTVGGLVLFYRSRVALGSGLLGYAGLIRPMACFAVAGAAVERVQRNRRSAMVVCLLSGAVVGLGVLLMRLWSGDALQNVRIYANDDKAYAGQLFALPFESLIMTPIRYHVPLWKIAYIWAYVVVTLTGCVIVVRRVRAPADAKEQRLASLNAPWLIGNTAFVLVVGHIWGFQEFHRFIVPALPPLLWVFREYYPKRLSAWIPIAGLSFVMALFGLLRSS